MSTFKNVANMVASTLVAGQLVETRSYKSTVGGAIYEILTPAQFVGTPDGFADLVTANGNIAKLFEDTPNLFQLGVLTGSVDNGPALKAIFENRFKTMIAHDGVVQLHTAVNATMPFGKHVVNVGQGRRSLINYTTPEAAITLTSPDPDFFLTLAGVGLTASADTTAAALTINYPFQTDYFRRQVSLANLDLVSLGGSAFAFADGIVLNNVWLSNIVDCVVQGDLNNQTRVASGITFKGQCIGCTVVNCQFNHVGIGVNITGTSQDIVIDSGRIIRVTDGIVANLDSTGQRLIVDAVSITATDHGIRTNNIDEVLLNGNRMTKMLTSNANYRDAYVANATGVVITSNSSVGAGAGGTDIGILFENVDFATVHDNVLLDRPTLITLDVNSSWVSGNGNVGDVGNTLVVDAGTNNKIIDAFA